MVLDYYRNHARDLAWRRTTNPYHILVSEIMLQQTQVDRVSRKYPEFIAAFPDFRSLANAPLPDVLSAWQGMGYNRRAIALRKCAIRVMEESGGILPDNPDVLAMFSGIGKATASSICAFAFNQPVVFIETNIRRVFIHFFFGNQAIVTDTGILPIVRETLYRKDPRTWYNALMDLGTDLKTRVPNPNRRSRHYAKQAAFEGSDRKIRGSLLKHLLEKKRMTRKMVARCISDDTERIDRIIQDLVDEGFVAWSGTYLTIPSQ
jgi:A/G-specific adenine glycosylase